MHSLITLILVFGTGSDFFIGLVMSVCCPKTEKIIYHPAYGTNCNNISGAYEYKHYRYDVKLCAFETCVDLLNHEDRYYCGKGDCNVFGWDCDDGCIQLNRSDKDKVSSLENRGKVVYLRDIFLMKYRDRIGRLFLSEVRGFAGIPEKHISLKLSSKVPIECV